MVFDRQYFVCYIKYILFHNYLVQLGLVSSSFIISVYPASLLLIEQ